MLVAGSTLLKQIGGMRTMQLTLLLGTASMMLFLQPSIVIALAACFVMGLSLGAATPAGSEVLQRFSPPNTRNLIFSIKQSGLPRSEESSVEKECVSTCRYLWPRHQ